MRRNRELINGATYYITCNINRFKSELIEEEIKELLFKTLEETKKRFEFDLNQFVVVDDHAHFIIKPDAKNKDKYSLSKIMQWLLGTFAVRYNKKTKQKGKVWYDRYKSEIIEVAEKVKKTTKDVVNQVVKASYKLKSFIIRILDNLSRFGIKNPNEYRYCGIIHINNKNPLITPVL